MKINPFDFFDKIYCINLPESKDRKLDMIKEFEKAGINNVNWIHAPRPPSNFKSTLYQRNAAGEFGCSLSGCKAVIHAAAADAKNVLVFDDDIKFISDAHNVLQKGLDQLKDLEWSVLYLGGNLLTRTRRTTSNLVKVTHRFDGSYAYAINGKYFLDFIEFWMYGITHGLYKRNEGKELSPYDVILSFFAEKTGCGYAIYPNIARPIAIKSLVDNVFYENFKLDERIERNWRANLIG
jgi:GR25 family glycosyltransferase involved in LPS biosynthesis